MTSERFSQTYRDVNELIAIASFFSGKGDKISSLETAAKWFDMSSETSYIKALEKDNSSPVHIAHVRALMKAKLIANSVITFITMVEDSSNLTWSLDEACIWVVDSRYALREDRKRRCEAALRSIYEFTPNHQPLLEKLLDAK